MDFTKNLPSAEEIIRALGLHTEKETSSLLPGLALFGAGILVGAGLAFLFAPVTGHELREDLLQRINELRERMNLGETSPPGDGGTTRGTATI